MFIRNAQKNEIFAISLVSFPSTGYKWDIIVNEGLELINIQTIAPRQGQGYKEQAVDGKVTMVYSFKPIVPGEFLLKFLYLRPWERQSSPKKTYEEKVIVS